MEELDRTFERTMLSKAALDIAMAYRKYRNLVKSGVDPDVAILQVIFGVYYAVPPGPPRPDTISTVNELYMAARDAQLHFSQLEEEAEASVAYLKEMLK